MVPAMALLHDPWLGGRLASPSNAWGTARTHHRHHVACQHGIRHASTASSSGGSSGGAPSTSMRADAYSASAPLSYTSSSLVEEQPAVLAPEDPQELQQQPGGGRGQQRQVAAGAPNLDPYSGGRPSTARAKKLKINQDLALYRARQTRISATRSRDQHERSRLLRQAEAALRTCLEVDPTDGRPYVSLGKILVLQRRYDEAAVLYEEGAAATGGTNAYIWTAWAYLASKQGNTSLARKLFDAAVVADASHAAAWHGWGLMEKGLGNFTKARDLWIKGIRATRARPNPYLFQSLAVLATEVGRTEEARRWFQLGTETVTGAASHALWQAWALMESKQGDSSLVRPLFQRGLSVSPRSRYTYLSWALWEKGQGNLAEARRLLKEGSERNPRDAAILQAWALLEEERGNVEEARRLFKKASLADPSHLYVWQAWGVMEARAGELDAARELFQQGVWSAPPRDRNVALLFQAWAVMEAGAGNHGMARQLFKCAVKADPKSEPSWLAWAEMEDSLGYLERGSELRSFSLQERQDVVRPANFTTMPAQSQNPLAQVSNLIAKWFHLGDESEVADIVDSLLPPQAQQQQQQQQQPASSAAAAATAAGGLDSASAAAPAAARRAAPKKKALKQ